MQVSARRLYDWLRGHEHECNVLVYHEYQGQIHAFLSLTKAIPQGMDCTWEIGDYLKERLT